ncbi:MAG: tRNA (adenosine(37)-N6)-threonylcarbamoyltransferase complex transferase subunit TsaD [Candidatus Taylorbacteria bacterium]
MITLGIETSCDETALAIIETRTSSTTDGPQIECRIIDSLVHSQAELHSAYGGVYPNLAKREHGKNLAPLLHKLLINSGDALKSLSHTGPTNDEISRDKFFEILESFKTDMQVQNPDLWQSLTGADFLRNIPPIDRITVTEGPGLEPALWVGIIFARVLGALWNVPIIPVNHMEGHVIGSLLTTDTPSGTWQKMKPIDFPALAFLISGGHTELVRIDNDPTVGSRLKYTIIGQTVDDAVGEAFDKVSRLLGLPYPGGPHISKLSEEAASMMTPSPVKLPRPMIHSGNLNFSFSGLKTAVLYATRAAAKTDGSLSDEFKRGLAHEFELAVSETLEYKLRSAIDEIGAKTIIMGGGVSANKMLRERLTKIATEYNIPIYLPTRHISGDNALMIALAGAMNTTPYSKIHTVKADGTKKLGHQ